MFWRTYTLYFYDTQGNLVRPANNATSGALSFKLAESFSNTGPSASLSPKKLLGKNFGGTVVIESPCDLHAHVLHRSPGGSISGNTCDLTLE